MSIELRIYVVKDSLCWERGNEIIGVNTLHVDTDPALFAQLGREDFREYLGEGMVAVEPKPLPKKSRGLCTFDEGGEHLTREDQHGAPLTFLTAGEFRRLRSDEDTSAWNRAVLAFVAALSPKTPIILDWY